MDLLAASKRQKAADDKPLKDTCQDFYWEYLEISVAFLNTHMSLSELLEEMI